MKKILAATIIFLTVMPISPILIALATYFVVETVEEQDGQDLH